MSNSKIDISDPVTDRKLTLQAARHGFGIHPERDFLYMHIEDKSEVSFCKVLNAIAQIHYEADFVVSSSAESIESTSFLDEDNIYLLPNIPEELHEYLEIKSRAVLDEEIALDTPEDELKRLIGKALKKENFTRDETTKVFIYKMATKHNPQKNS